jgi:hypothetical protein
MLHFTGDNGKTMSFELNAIFHPNLSQDFLLSRDFTGSDAKAYQTNNHLVLTNTYEVYWEHANRLSTIKSYESSHKPYDCHTTILSITGDLHNSEI